MSQNKLVFLSDFWMKVLAEAKRLPRTRFKNPRVSLLANVCAVLQGYRGNDCFFLSTHEAGNLCGVSHVTAWNDLNKLESEGTITELETGSTRGKIGRATKWKYNGHKRIDG